ncbi:hypothetical protein C8J56DRAFT_889679 [Mycena floridula]|nr:hypothetical protein C8J56DRAFT_889679 [Mycena floridula]
MSHRGIHSRTSASAAPTQSTTQVVTPTKSLKIPGAIATDGIKPTFTTADSSPLSSRKRQRKIERLNAIPYIFNSVIPARSLSKLVELAQQNDAAKEDDANSEYFSVASVHVPEHNSPVALDSNIPHLTDSQAEAALLTEIIHLRREIASGEVHPMTYSGEESPGRHSRETSLPSYPGSAI